MTEVELRQLLKNVREGNTPVEEAIRSLKSGPFKQRELEAATPDYHRVLRQGLCEVIFVSRKTSAQIVAIARELAETDSPVLVTRLDEQKSSDLSGAFPRGRPNDTANTFLINPPERMRPQNDEPHVVIVTAGTSDLPVAEEAAEVCVATRTPFELIVDVGVAGLHRILNRIEDLERATALIVVAGMDGALPSVVGGLVGKPIFAVPTSVGYGAGFQGVAALLTMLNSCAPCISVVNIDNGYGAGCAACRVVAAVRTEAGRGI